MLLLLLLLSLLLLPLLLPLLRLLAVAALCGQRVRRSHCGRVSEGRAQAAPLCVCERAWLAGCALARPRPGCLVGADCAHTPSLGRKQLQQ
jgi:hypothetical protein